MPRIVYQALSLIAIGLMAGVVHSCNREVEFHPRNNPDPAQPAPAEHATPGESAAPVTPPDPNPDAAAPTTPPPTTPPQPAPEQATPAAATRPNYFITVARAKELWDKGQRDGSVYFVDARNQEAFARGHVRGAMNILPGAFSGTPAQAANYLPGQTVVVYCVGKECTDSEAVMIGLQNMKKGIGPIYIMHDGYQAWADAGNPTATGPDNDHP
jgi:rhodanese-related sulfurtransferase